MSFFCSGSGSWITQMLALNFTVIHLADLFQRNLRLCVRGWKDSNREAAVLRSLSFVTAAWRLYPCCKAAKHLRSSSISLSESRAFFSMPSFNQSVSIAFEVSLQIHLNLQYFCSSRVFTLNCLYFWNSDISNSLLEHNVIRPPGLQFWGTAAENNLGA